MPPVELTIVFDPQTGAVNARGPIDNKLLCMGMLEMGKKAILDHDPARVPGILLAQPGPVELPNGAG